jgi:hypothetical protein
MVRRAGILWLDEVTGEVSAIQFGSDPAMLIPEHKLMS